MHRLYIFRCNDKVVETVSETETKTAQSGGDVSHLRPTDEHLIDSVQKMLLNAMQRYQITL